MKIASWRKSLGDQVRAVHGTLDIGKSPVPDRIYITSLFTYRWQEVRKAALFYRNLYPDAELFLGGIYASLMPDHARTQVGIEPHVGILEETEPFPPDYETFKGWPGSSSSYVYTTRGCPRKCKFCGSRKIFPAFITIDDWMSHIDLLKDSVVVLDENITAAPFDHFESVMRQLSELSRDILFCNGFDCRLITADHARLMAKARMPQIRLAFDTIRQDGHIQRAIDCLAKAGIHKRHLLVYILYNFKDDMEDAMYRATEMHKLGVRVYPMRYKPLDWLDPKNMFVDPNWEKQDVIDFYNYWKSFVAPHRFTFDEWRSTGKNWTHSNRRKKLMGRTSERRTSKKILTEPFDNLISKLKKDPQSIFNDNVFVKECFGEKGFE